MFKIHSFKETLDHLSPRPIVTIACGATCAYLGDERNLREFVIADEAASALRQSGHTVFSLLFDDSLDPLNFRQLRVAVNKDEKLIERCRKWCGKPISVLPDPWDCCESYAAHFEKALLDRLHHLDCHPALISTANLYERGVYAPYLKEVFERHAEILAFLYERFPDYHPSQLFSPICPDCGYIDETRVERISGESITFTCGRCERAKTIPFDQIKGKLSWKLDCALRWALFKVDAEPFNKAYLEPQTGSFVIAQALSRRFFNGHPVLPLHYGLITMDKQFGGMLLKSLPAAVLRALLVERPAADLTITRDLILAAASRHEVIPDMNYLNFVKQIMPVWLLTPESLSAAQRELVGLGAEFSRHFLGNEMCLSLPRREDIEGESPEVLSDVQIVLSRVIQLRKDSAAQRADYGEAMRTIFLLLGERKKAVFHRLRLITGQEHGLPVTRILTLLPLSYLQLTEYILDLHLTNASAAKSRPVVTVDLNEDDDDEEDAANDSSAGRKRQYAPARHFSALAPAIKGAPLAA